MKSVASEHYWRLFHALPADVRREARRAFKLFTKDPNTPELHFKLVIRRHNVWSIRFGDQYRAMGERQGDRSYWIWIGKHTEYEQIIHGTRRERSTEPFFSHLKGHVREGAIVWPWCCARMTCALC